MLAFALAALVQSTALAQSIDEESVSIVRSSTVFTTPQASPLPVDRSDNGLLILDSIINIGTKLWNIVENNRPVVDVNTQYATALPRGSRSWDQFDSWQPPEGAIYRLTAKNTYGVRVIDVRYQVLRTYGGRHKGKGRYLTAVTVVPLLVDVAWGYKFSMTSEVPDSGVVNVGTSADPVAGMLVTLRWRIETAVKDSQGKGVYFLQGDGLFKEVGGPFRGQSLERAQTVVDASINPFK